MIKFIILGVALKNRNIFCKEQKYEKNRQKIRAQQNSCSSDSDTAILNNLPLDLDEKNLIYFLLNPCPKKQMTQYNAKRNGK
jgi:hypothetical protein